MVGFTSRTNMLSSAGAWPSEGKDVSLDRFRFVSG